jgi:hypothetical protein
MRFADALKNWRVSLGVGASGYVRRQCLIGGDIVVAGHSHANQAGLILFAPGVAQQKNAAIKGRTFFYFLEGFRFLRP